MATSVGYFYRMLSLSWHPRLTSGCAAFLFVAAMFASVVPALAQASPSPTKVYTGVYVNDIQDVNLETDTYTVDFYIWMRWNNPKVDPSSEIDLMNSYDSWGTVATPATEKPVRLKDGSMYRLIHYQGKFNTKFPLTKYPFDRQGLTVQIEDFNSSSEKIVFVPDAKPVELASGLSLPGYEVGAPTMTIADQPYSTTFGDTGLKAPADYSRITVTVPVTRPGLPYTVKLLLPMLVVLLCAGLVFLISPIHIDGRIALAITALLTLVALKFMVDSELPNVDYLTMVDAIYIVAFASVGMGLLQVVLSSRRLNRGESVDVIIARDHKTLMIGGAAYLTVSAIVIAAFLL